MDLSRFAPYLGIVAALALGVLVVAFSGSVTVSRPPETNSPAATSTLSVLPDVTLPDITLPDLVPETSAATASPERAPFVPEKTNAPAPKPSVPVAAPVPAAATTSAPAPMPVSGNDSLDRAATALRAALVNIICYVPVGSGLHSISGSGVVVDPKGFILTNAHIAQYFLLADRSVSCTVRTGSPAAKSYSAALAYLPSRWISANAGVLTQATPTGTGEYDFALLAVTKSETSAPLPAPFSFIPLAYVPPTAGASVVIASYGAQFLESAQVQSSLFPTIVFGSVKDVFTFATNTIDVLALGGSAAAQEGSSGGGIADAAGTLVGTITTSTVEGDTSARSLDAITASYIRAEYANETGSAFESLLAKSPSSAVTDFAQQIPALEAILTANLP